jgi:hypothetical protein
MSIGIGEECHPEIVIIHLRDQMRFVLERDAALGQLIDGERDVRAAKVDATLRPEAFLRFFEEQPDSGTIEKCQIAEAI